jgi:hypothetical protein
VGDAFRPRPLRVSNIGTPEKLPPGPRDRWSAVRREVVVRAEPTRGAAEVAQLDVTTPEGTTNIVGVLGSEIRGDRRLWVRVRTPTLPNNTVGWVPRDALGGYG